MIAGMAIIFAFGSPRRGNASRNSAEIFFAPLKETSLVRPMTTNTYRSIPSLFRFFPKAFAANLISSGNFG